MLRQVAFLFSATLLVIAGATIPTHSASAMPDQLVSSEYQIRSGELLEILKGSEKEEQFFASSFLDAVPLPQFRMVLAQLKTQYGEPVSVTRIIPASNLDGTVEIAFEKATVAIRMVIDSAKPHPVIGLLVTGANLHGDGLSKIRSEFEALPGKAGFDVAELSGVAPTPVEGINGDAQYAIGSTFKLYVLAELARSIGAGERNWSDVALLTTKSLPSGVLQKWPDDAPLTLQTLATVMITISDNSATDTLMYTLGRDKIANTVRKTNHSNLDKMLPMLTTLEAFALKMPGNDKLRKRYVKASETDQVKLLESEQNRLGLDSVNITNLANKPRLIDEIEWFASPSDVSRLMRYLHRQNDPVVRKILAINQIIPPGDAKRWTYLGGKGGSEPGVVSYAFLVTASDGKAYAVSGSWNNSDAPVDGNKFLLLMNRLLNIMAKN